MLVTARLGHKAPSPCHAPRKPFGLGSEIRVFQNAVGSSASFKTDRPSDSPCRSHIRPGLAAVACRDHRLEILAWPGRQRSSPASSCRRTSSAGCSSAATTAQGVQIAPRWLGLVGQMGRAVLHLGDLGLEGRSSRPSPGSRASCPCGCGPGAPSPRPWVSRCRSTIRRDNFAKRASIPRRNPRRVSLRTMLRSAALASMVKASTPMRSPLTRPASAIKARTQSEASPCGPHGAGARGSVTARNGLRHTIPAFRSRRNSRMRQGIRAAPWSSPRSESMPSK